MLITCLKIFSGSLIPYIASVQVKSLYKNDNFCNYFKKHLIKIYASMQHQIAPFLKMFSEDLLNPVMYAPLLLFEKKITIQKGPLFSNFQDPF